MGSGDFLCAAKGACVSHSQLLNFHFLPILLSPQSQVLNYEKDMDNLVRMDHDKTEQLESLKEENRQLRMTVTQQVKPSLNIKVLGEAREQRLRGVLGSNQAQILLNLMKSLGDSLTNSLHGGMGIHIGGSANKPSDKFLWYTHTLWFLKKHLCITKFCNADSLERKFSLCLHLF